MGFPWMQCFYLHDVYLAECYADLIWSAKAFHLQNNNTKNIGICLNASSHPWSPNSSYDLDLMKGGYSFNVPVLPQPQDVKKSTR